MTQGRAAALAESVEESGYPRLVLDRIAKQTCQVIGAERSCLVVRDRSEPSSAIAAAACGGDGDVVGSRLDADSGLTGKALHSEGPEIAYERRIPPAAAVPVHWRGRVRGALHAENGKGAPVFGVQELRLLSSLAHVAGAALDHSEHREELLLSLRHRLCAFVAALDKRDGYTAGHSEEVVDLSRRLGEKLGLDPIDMLELELGALLHDVGKLSLRAALLRKPAPLDADERAVVQRHPDWGAELLAGVPGLEPVATIVRFHHERWDGQGYPAGLEGERIPLASRIIAVCDAYEAMRSDRPYRKSLSEETAIAELRACAGSQFDPALVDAFIELRSPTTQTKAALAAA